MPDRYDVIVAGLGAAGSAAVYQLSKRGLKVLGIDKFSPPHTQGSSHGDSRISRQAIGEGQYYTPIVLRANQIWREIEEQTGQTLLTTNGAIIIGGPRSKDHRINFFENTVSAAKRYDIEHELLDSSAIAKRFPHFNVADDEQAYYEPGGGFLRPEACISAQLRLAEDNGARLVKNETVESFIDNGTKVTVKTDKDSYEADQLVVSVGSWASKLFPEYRDFLSVRRQILYWFDIEGPADAWLPEHCPVYIWDEPDRPDGIYGFPAINGPNGGIKIASHQFSLSSDPDNVDRSVTKQDIEYMYNTFIKSFFPGLKNHCLKTVTCLYTVAPKYDFVIDRHPKHQNVILASPCSGHGFKHSAAVGEILADLVQHKDSQFDLSHFSIDNFKG